jgi:cephalosporin-C deacetylase-like acetyl esterase
MKKTFILAAFLNIALVSFAQDYSFFGTHNKPSPIYSPGETMEFTVKLLDGENPVAGKKLKWNRTGDDGITKSGEGISSAEGMKITCSTEKPGFVRLYVTAQDEDGKPINSTSDKQGKITPVFFDGGACVEPEKLQGVPEPADFDAYWKKQKEILASVPLKVIEMKEVPGNDKVKAFDVKIACAGKMPVSGYLVMPKDAKEKSLPAEVAFMGAGVSSANKNLQAGANKIFFHINAHGIKNGESKEYYDELANNALKGYAFDKQENANPDTCYFNGMFLRVMRALEFVKSLPEWNGKDLRASGGSQGGFQSLVAAGLDKDVTDCFAWSPWNCDFGRTELGRIVGGWHIAYSPALNYYDPINHAKRANPKCTLFIISNLGDYVCPPSGVWIAYTNFSGPKTMEIRQGCEHGFTMKNYPKFTISANQPKKNP